MTFGNYPEDDLEREMRAIRTWLVAKLREAKLPDIVAVITGPLLVILGVIGACIYWGQLEEIRHTNELTQQALNSSGVTLDKTLEKMQAQIDESKQQTAKFKILAENSGTEAGAASSSATIAKQALQISERAYLFTENESVSGNPARFISAVVNSGRLPAEDISFTLYEETDTLPSGQFLEGHWSEWQLNEVPVSTSGVTAYDITTNAPLADSDQINNGKLILIVAGTIDYNDGFEKTPTQTSWFCYHSFYVTDTKTNRFVPCDARQLIPVIKQVIGYPRNFEAAFK